MKIRKEVKHILHLDSLAPGVKSNLLDCETLDLSDTVLVAVTVRYTCHPSATGGMDLNVFTGVDTMVFDKDPWYATSLPAAPGIEYQKTLDVAQGVWFEPMYMKVQLENLDGTYPVTDIDVWATLVKFE
jgi:hypothetical protein